jgi:predicted neutral ceramidase superfamily lipid hydrolase
MKNWKTNLAALFTALVGLATLLGYISQEVAEAILFIGVTFGFAVAQDSKPKKFTSSEDNELIGTRPPKKDPNA